MAEPIPYSRLRTALRYLSLTQAKQLHAELAELIQILETSSEPEVPINEHREVVGLQRVGETLYQFERVRCGKPGCRCAGKDGVLHGPYWYAYWRDSGKLRSKYIGKKLNFDKGP